jgi:putative membrane protein
MVYDQNNLPLSYLKVVKKTLAQVWPMLIWILIIGVAVVLPILASAEIPDFSFSMLTLLFFMVVIFAVIFGYQHLYYKTYKYIFNEEDAEIGKGVITRATGHVVYGKLQNIYIDQDLLDRIMGLYDVHYETAGERSTFYSHVDGLNKENADKLVTFLKGRVLRGSSPLPTVPEQEEVKISPILSSVNISSGNYPLSPKTPFVRALSITQGWAIILTISLAFTFASAITALVSGNPMGGGLSGIFVGVMILVGSLFAIFLVVYLTSYIYYKNFRFELDAEKATIKVAVFSSSVSSFYYNRIQDVNLSQDIFDRLFGVASINIETAGGGGSISFGRFTLSQADEIKNFLLEKTRAYHRSV